MITKVSVILKVQTVKTASTTLGGTLAAVSLSFTCLKVFVDKIRNIKLYEILANSDDYLEIMHQLKFNLLRNTTKLIFSV